MSQQIADPLDSIAHEQPTPPDIERLLNDLVAGEYNRDTLIEQGARRVSVYATPSRIRNGLLFKDGLTPVRWRKALHGCYCITLMAEIPGHVDVEHSLVWPLEYAVKYPEGLA